MSQLDSPDHMTPLLDRFSSQLGQLMACQQELGEQIEEALDYIGRRRTLNGYVVVPADKDSSVVGLFSDEMDAATYGLDRDIGFDVRWFQPPDADAEDA